jgi:hypothetical protein
MSCAVLFVVAHKRRDTCGFAVVSATAAEWAAVAAGGLLAAEAGVVFISTSLT